MSCQSLSNSVFIKLPGDATKHFLFVHFHKFYPSSYDTQNDIFFNSSSVSSWSTFPRLKIPRLMLFLGSSLHIDMYIGERKSCKSMSELPSGYERTYEWTWDLRIRLGYLWIYTAILAAYKIFINAGPGETTSYCDLSCFSYMEMNGTVWVCRYSSSLTYKFD